MSESIANENGETQKALALTIPLASIMLGQNMTLSGLLEFLFHTNRHQCYILYSSCQDTWRVTFPASGGNTAFQPPGREAGRKSLYHKHLRQTAG
jgi:hypothetical protein